MFEHLYSEIKGAAANAAPKELAAVIVKDELIVLKNVAPDPLNDFALSEPDTARYVIGRTAQAIVHSHPATDVYKDKDGLEVLDYRLARLTPSMTDMRQQQALKIPYVIAAENPSSGAWEVFEIGDHMLDAPILSQQFRHGAVDCYELIRKWYWQHRGEKLMAMPRDEYWWGNQLAVPPKPAQADLYIEHFEACGAERIYPRHQGELQAGDVFLMKMMSSVYNHGGVFVGNGMVWHHMPGRYSAQLVLTDAWFRKMIWLRKAPA